MPILCVSDPRLIINWPCVHKSASVAMVRDYRHEPFKHCRVRPNYKRGGKMRDQIIKPPCLATIQPAMFYNRPPCTFVIECYRTPLPREDAKHAILTNWRRPAMLSSGVIRCSRHSQVIKDERLPRIFMEHDPARAAHGSKQTLKLNGSSAISVLYRVHFTSGSNTWPTHKTLSEICSPDKDCSNIWHQNFKPYRKFYRGRLRQQF
jgi:hypothetical protein